MFGNSMASVNKCGCDFGENLEISRGDGTEAPSLDWSKIDNLIVYDEHGREIRVGDIYKSQKTILILVRHFLCFICKEYVDDLSLIPDSYLQEADVQLVVVGCSKLKFIKPFRHSTYYTQKLYVDPDRLLYKALGCIDTINISSSVTESKHVKSGFFSGVLQSTLRGLRYCEMQGDINQQGGAFILGPGHNILFAHRDNSAIDHVPINDLLCLAGVTQVNFDKDKRVLTI